MIRPAREEDLECLPQLEAGSQLTPWSRKSFLRCLEADGLFRVLEREGQPIAYAVFLVMPPEAELLRVAVHPDVRGCGHAGPLLEACFDDLRERGVRDCFLEVREGNQGARKLYERLGFSVGGIRRDYYRNPDEDAIVMWRGLKAQGSRSE